MKLYGLFLNTYDYFEWHDLIAVSDDLEKLKILPEISNRKMPLLTGDKQRKAINDERTHFVIEPVEFL